MSNYSLKKNNAIENIQFARKQWLKSFSSVNQSFLVLLISLVISFSFQFRLRYRDRIFVSTFFELSLQLIKFPSIWIGIAFRDIQDDKFSIRFAFKNWFAFDGFFASNILDWFWSRIPFQMNHLFAKKKFFFLRKTFTQTKFSCLIAAAA